MCYILNCPVHYHNSLQYLCWNPSMFLSEHPTLQFKLAISHIYAINHSLTGVLGKSATMFLMKDKHLNPKAKVLSFKWFPGPLSQLTTGQVMQSCTYVGRLPPRWCETAEARCKERDNSVPANFSLMGETLEICDCTKCISRCEGG